MVQVQLLVGQDLEGGGVVLAVSAERSVQGYLSSYRGND